MPASGLPPGHYLSCAFRVTVASGGQTRALLMRNRRLAEAGARPHVLTLGAAPDNAERRAALIEHGLLGESIPILNIYDHYRERGWGDPPAGAPRLPDLAEHRIAEDAAADGSPWRVTYRVPGEARAVYDYLRPDGSPFLRLPAFGLAAGSRGRGRILQVSPDGLIAGEFRTAGQWFRRWIRTLAEGHERAFVFLDSRYLVPHVVPIRARRIHLVYVMHNLHVVAPYRWDSPVAQPYRRVLDRIGGLDAMVTLTERQRDDIAERRGRTSNMFVVPNPVDMPARRPDPPGRDPDRVAIVARLEPQKRLGDAIAAFAQVVEEVPAARLDIYGSGSRREALQAAIERLGLGGHVTLRGFDPAAREALWTSSAFVMTSAFEGYPLSTLESMSRGCPVVSYDIRYGPREQITDGVDGFLVAPGDLTALAARIVELLRSPELVARMSAAAVQSAGRFGSEHFVSRWAEVLRTAVEQAPRRTRLQEVRLDVRRLAVGRSGRARFSGALTVRGRSRRSDLGSAAVSLAAVAPETGQVTALPLRVRRDGGELRFDTPLRPLGPRVPAGAGLRLRLTWENSAWQTELAPAVEAGRAGGSQT